MENDNGTQAPQTGAESPVSPTEQQSQSPTQDTASPAITGAQTQAQPENVPFDKHPRWKQLQQERKREREQFAQLQRQYQEQQGYLQALRQNGQQTNQMPPEQKAQLDALVEMLSPVLKERLGLNKLETLEKQFGELSTSWQSNQAETELNKELEALSKLGIDPEEARAEIEDVISQTELDYRPGLIRMVVRSHFWDRRGEIAERAVNKETIEKREALKKGQTQTTSSKGQPAQKSESSDPVQRAVDLIRGAGGMGEIAFNR